VSDSSLHLSYNLKVSLPRELFRDVEVNFLDLLLNKHLISQIIDVLQNMSHLRVLCKVGCPRMQKLRSDVVSLRNVFIVLLGECVDTSLCVFKDIRSEFALFFQIV
jgi:hypothetical protein